MRRLLLLAAGLLLLGLSTAFAASFSVQAEDITSFSTPVLITVPEAPPRTLWLHGPSGTNPGTLSPNSPSGGVQWRLIELDQDTPIDEQAAPARYFTWQLTVTGVPMVIGGPTNLFITQQNKNGSRLTAGIFNCPAGEPAASTNCTQIGTTAIGPTPTGGSSPQIKVAFGVLPTTPIPVGNELRVKVVNRGVDDDANVLSTEDWRVAWGNASSHGSRLEIGP